MDESQEAEREQAAREQEDASFASHEPKIPWIEVIFVGGFIAFIDLLQILLIILVIDVSFILDIMMWPVTVLWATVWRKVNPTWIIVGNVLSTLPYIGFLPWRVGGFVITVVTENSQTARAAIKAVGADRVINKVGQLAQKFQKGGPAMQKLSALANQQAAAARASSSLQQSTPQDPKEQEGAIATPRASQSAVSNTPPPQTNPNYTSSSIGPRGPAQNTSPADARSSWGAEAPDPFSVPGAGDKSQLGQLEESMGNIAAYEKLSQRAKNGIIDDEGGKKTTDITPPKKPAVTPQNNENNQG